MNLVRRAAQQVGAGLSIADFDRVLDMMFGGAPTYTGKTVSQQTALAVAMVWTCCECLSDDLAALPIYPIRDIIQDNEPAQEEAKDHYLWPLLTREANPEMTSFRFKQLMQMWKMLWGNAYAEIEISGRGQVTALWPWRPDRVRVTRAGSPSGPLQYTYVDRNGDKYTVPHERMLHLRGMSLDGIMGLSPIEHHKQTVGLSMAVQEHGSRFFSNGARPLGILTTAQKLSDPARNRLSEDWKKGHQGLDNAHRVAILEEGLQWQEVGMKMVDAQYIETAKFTAEDIARIYKMPFHRVGLSSPGTNSGVEEMALEYIQYTLGPLATNWSQEIQFACLSPYESRTISVQSDFGNLLQGNHEAMGKFISTLRQWGIANADECRRRFLRWNAIKGGAGKEYWQPVNMQPEGGAGDSTGTGAKPPAMQLVPQDQQKTKPNGKPNGSAAQY